MALSTRDGLIAAIPSHMMGNTTLTSAICADFILMVEAEMNRAFRDRKMTARTDAIVDAEYAVVPEDFQGEISLTLDDSANTKVQFVDPGAFAKRINDYTDTGTPKYCTIIGDEFRFLPVPSDSYTADLVYWQGVPALTDGSDTNWILTKHPDAYLYGCLMHAAAFLKDFDQKAMYEAWFARAIGDIEQSGREEAMGGTLMMSVGAVV